ncbi:hypothetical protein [Thioclava sp. GXIMD2076]|uniref:hypothetical protein n=1 Tax=Thioclava sp. GXIMD2076 TaxID=3131931 RepID=UPI0030CDDFD0
MDTQSGQSGSGRAEALAKTVAARDTLSDSLSEEDVETNVADNEILSLPAGPSPAFRVSLLEQQAARVRASTFPSQSSADMEAGFGAAYSSLTHELFQTETGWSASVDPSVDVVSGPADRVGGASPHAAERATAMSVLDVTR